MPHTLSLFTGEAGPTGGAPAPRPAVPMTLGELLRAAAPAAVEGRAWLDDFADEPVLVTADLCELLRASEAVHRTGASERRRAA